MTEVVRDTAATMQQLFVVERQQRLLAGSPSNPNANAPPNQAFTRPPGALASDSVAPAPKPDQTQADSRRQDQPSPDQKLKRSVLDSAEFTRASRSESRGGSVMLEIKDFDVGQRAAEIVGTPDIVQRFDNNLDGRVDRIESQRAAKGRDSATTFSALGSALSETPTGLEPVQVRVVAEGTDIPAPPMTALPQPAPAQQAGQSAETGTQPQKLFDNSQVVVGGPFEDGTVPKKLFGSEEVASQGTFSDGTPVDQKFFGDGLEIVRGRFTNDPEVQQKNIDDSKQAEPGRLFEEGSGERELYDKVAQTESSRFYEGEEQQRPTDSEGPLQNADSGEGQRSDPSLVEEILRKEVQLATTGEDDRQTKRKYADLDLYAEVASLVEEKSEIPGVGVGPITT